MKSFQKFLSESAEAAPKGTMEIAKTDVEKAAKYLEKIAPEIYADIQPSFVKSYSKVKSLAQKGSTKRKDMPRLRRKDVQEFQKRLKEGYIDIKAPFSKDTDPKNPFPEGLSGEKAKSFLEAGLSVHDGGNAKDDRIKVQQVKRTISDLKPIQEQIYLSESVDILKRRGLKKAIAYLSQESIFIISSDNRIIDGHHRWCAGVLADEKMKVTCISIDLPISKLLPLSLAYGDAIGNARNK